MARTFTPTLLWDATKAITVARLNQYIGNDGVNPGNLDYLFTRPQGVVNRNNGANYTTTSLSQTPIDSTNLTFTDTFTGTKILVFLRAFQLNANAGVSGWFDFQVDGVNQNMFISVGIPAAANWQASLTHVALLTVAAGSHTLRPTWSNNGGGTLTLVSNGATQLVTFGYVEVG